VAYDFNGSNQYLELSFTAGRFPTIERTGSQEFTAHIWMQQDAGGGDCFSLCQSTSASDYCRIFHNVADSKVLTWQRPEFDVANSWSTATPTLGTWVAAGITIGSNGVNACAFQQYVNGVADATQGKLVDVNQGDFDRLDVGRLGDSSPSNYCDGRVAEVAVWTRILTPGEFKALAAGYSPLFFAEGLVHYFPLVRDLRCLVSGESLTAYNAPAVAVHPRMIYPSGLRVPGVAAAAAPGGVSIPALYYLLKRRTNNA
jgi:hypothetical protein